jgi:capsid portal protein
MKRNAFTRKLAAFRICENLIGIAPTHGGKAGETERKILIHCESKAFRSRKRLVPVSVNCVLTRPNIETN